jgi:CubicO group peptidase (beta-lactamase class C family)
MWVLAVFGVVAAVLAAWMIVAGPVTVLRFLRYGPTTIDDFKHYPGRALSASPEPFHFAEHADPGRVPAQVQPGDAPVDLEAWLDQTRTIAFLVVKDDAIIYERYSLDHAADAPSQSFSVSKSIFSLLVGMAIDDGYFRSVDQPITDYLPELAPHGFGAVTIRHLLQMSSGTNYVENDNPFGIHVRLNYTPSLARDILGFRMRGTPGAEFKYRSGDTALLSLALTRALGGPSLTAYAEQRLWTPLGMEHGGVWSIDHEGDGLERAWCCLAGTARDFAKVGRLYLRNGDWDGRQLVSPGWVEASTRQGGFSEAQWPDEFRRSGLTNYGYHWWLVSPERGDALALGKDGQFIYFDPASQVVIVRLGRRSPGGWVRIFTQIAAEAR